MILRTRAARILSLVSLLVVGVVGLRAAHAQDAAPPAAGADPNAPSGAGPDLNAPPPAAPQGTATVQEPAAAPYKPVLLMPFVGINSIQNKNSGTGPGFRVGGMGGARLNPLVSANFELLFDMFNFDNVPGTDVSEYVIQAAVAPLVHLPLAPMAEVVVGPKAGGFFAHDSFSGGGFDVTGSAEGWMVGANLGAFFKVSEAASVGGLFNFDYLRAASCSSSGGTCTVNSDGTKMISLTAAAQF